MTVATDDRIVRVLERAGRPMTTIKLGRYLTNGRDEVNWPQLRRSLDRLEAEGVLVSSGGPRRERLEGWPHGDRRDVYWTTAHLASVISQRVEEEQEQALTQQMNREGALRELYNQIEVDEREALGLTGLIQHLKRHPDATAEVGIMSLSTEAIETIAYLAGVWSK